MTACQPDTAQRGGGRSRWRWPSPWPTGESAGGLSCGILRVPFGTVLPFHRVSTRSLLFERRLQRSNAFQCAFDLFSNFLSISLRKKAFLLGKSRTDTTQASKSVRMASQTFIWRSEEKSFNYLLLVHTQCNSANSGWRRHRNGVTGRSIGSRNYVGRIPWTQTATATSRPMRSRES